LKANKTCDLLLGATQSNHPRAFGPTTPLISLTGEAAAALTANRRERKESWRPILLISVDRRKSTMRRRNRVLPLRSRTVRQSS